MKSRREILFTASLWGLLLIVWVCVNYLIYVIRHAQ